MNIDTSPQSHAFVLSCKTLSPSHPKARIISFISLLIRQPLQLSKAILLSLYTLNCFIAFCFTTKSKHRRMILRYINFLLWLFLFAGTNLYAQATPRNNQQPSGTIQAMDNLHTTDTFNKKQKTIITNTNLQASINLNNEKQTIHSFGASDCWSIKFIGKNWSLAKRNQIADLLFSKEVDANGNPKGIGLSMWRINVGAGSSEQGERSHISSEWRREECFQNAAGTYDWNKQAGNRWFAKAAKDRGVEKLLLFSIAAPVHLSKNGLASGSPDSLELGKMNIKPGKFDDYAGFLAKVAKFYTQAGMPINYISPVNETNWNWVLGKNGKASQEGTAATNAEIFQLTSALNKSLTDKKVAAKIAVCESGSHENTVSLVAKEPERSNFINYFWNASSPGYLGNMQAVEKLISSHSYGAQSNVNNLINYRKQIVDKIDSVLPRINFWQSEYCILTNEDGTNGKGRDLGMDAALYLARVLHTDLAVGNATSWQWWLSVSPSDYKDGLVYITDANGKMGELPATKTDGQIHQSKMLWALGNYSRFIRPGMIRVETALENYTDPIAAANGLMLSAYKNPTTKEMVAVVINMKTTEEKISFSGVSFSGKGLKKYTTSATKQMEYSFSNASVNITIGPKSIVTLVANYH